MESKLIEIRDWAQSKIDAGQEPPWSWYQYMKLVETVNAVLAAQAVTKPADSPEEGQRRDRRLQLVDEGYQQDSAQHHSVGLPVQLPM